MLNIDEKDNLILTGGHAGTTAIAVIEEIKKNHYFKNFDIFWVGSKLAKEGSKEETLEYKILPKLGVKFVNIVTGKLQTKFTLFTIWSILKIPIGFLHAFFIIFKIRPKLTLSFGGYASLPIVFWSWVFGISAILHEQTVCAGRATLASVPFAKKVTLARAESLSFFPKSKSIVVGNPIRKSVLRVRAKDKINNPPNLLIMGGSRGSEFINELTNSFSDRFKNSYKIIHLAGGIKNVNPDELANLYEKSDLIISRSGANTVSEIIYIKRPTILIPLPRTFMMEQEKNASNAKKFGIAKVLSETEATPQRVETEIENMTKNWQKIVDIVRLKPSPDLGATEKLVKILEEFV